MPTIDYKFELDQRVVTPFGDSGIVTSLGFDDGGNTYYVKTRAAESNWFKEKELTPGSAMKELTEDGFGVFRDFE